MPDADRTEIERLADQLERSLRGGAWHGPALAEACAGLDAAGAARRAIPGSHTAREIVDHVAFWLEAARRQTAGEEVGALEPEADWPESTGDDERAWRSALERLEQAHRGLRSALLATDDARLDAPVAGSDPTLRGMLLGILQHNAYHAGQILLLGRAGGGGSREDAP